MSELCPVHGVPLEMRSVPIRYGLPADPPKDYWEIHERLFPLGDEFVSGGCDVEEKRREVVSFCEVCHAANIAWNLEHGSSWMLLAPPRPPENPEIPKLLFSGRHLNLLRRRGWEYAEHRKSSESVMIVAITADRRIVLAEEFRPSVNAGVISLPSGLSADAQPEDPRQAAGRELAEETGYESAEWELLSRGPGSAGASSEIVFFFLARDARRTGEQSAEDRELIRVHVVPIGELRSWSREREAEGLLVDPKVWAGLYLALAAPGLDL